MMKTEMMLSEENDNEDVERTSLLLNLYTMGF